MASGQLYLCGAMANCDYFERHAWREEATALLGREHVLDPTRRDWTGKELTAEEEKQLVEQDLADIRESSGVLAYIWKPSFGSPMELVMAKLWRKPVAVVIPYNSRPSPWIKYHADYLTHNGIADGVNWLKERLRWQ